MENLKNFYETHKKQILLGLGISLVILVACLSFIKIENKYKIKEDKQIITAVVEKKIDEPSLSEDKKQITSIKVDVKGFVINEGVYSLEENSRVIDAILMAGGLKDGAYTRYLNLSKKLNDEDVIIVNNYEEVEKMKQDNGVQEEIPCETTNQACIEEDKIITSSPNEVKNDNKIEKKEEYTPELNTLVNINTADKEALMTLKGIGESKADKIIDYRNSHGHFKTIEEIKNVSGIGDSIYEKIKELITVE